MDGFRGADGRAALDLIGEIYDTGTEAHAWDELLGSVASFVGASSGIMGVTDMATAQSAPGLITTGLDPEIVEERWLGEFGLQDVWAEGGHAPSEGDVCVGGELRPFDEIRRLPVYSAVHEPLGIGDCLVTALQTTPHRVMYASFYRPRSHGRFGENEAGRLRPLAPHLVRAAHLQSLIERTALRERASRKALDELGFAVFALAGGHAEPLNRLATELISSGRGLRHASGRLTARDPDSNVLLEAAIHLAGGARVETTGAGIATPFRIRVDAISLPLTCWTVPLDRGLRFPNADLPGQSGALLLVSDPEIDRTITAETVAALFDITPAEARVAAAIASGETLKEYSKRTGLSDNTVRGQLKQAQSKLGTPRQVDLALLISRAVAPNRC